MPRKKWMKSTFQNVQQFGSTMSLKILNIQYSIRQYILSCLKLIIQTFCSPLTTKLLKCYLILTNGANFRKLFLPKIPNFTPSQGNSTHTPSAVRSLLSDTMLCRQQGHWCMPLNIVQECIDRQKIQPQRSQYLGIGQTGFMLCFDPRFYH